MLSLEVDSDGFTSAAPSLSTSSSRESDEGAFAVSKATGAAKPRRVWTAVEDAAISQLVTEVGSQSWSLIAGTTHALRCLP
eukprot:18029-Heterococcus_DN1.PRE.2